MICGSRMMMCAPGCLQEWGVRESVLGRKGTPERVPAWLEKWAALVLEFIEEERLLLSEQLCTLQLPYTAYTPAAAAIEAKGSASSRDVWCFLVLVF